MFLAEPDKLESEDTYMLFMPRHKMAEGHIEFTLSVCVCVCVSINDHHDKTMCREQKPCR